MTSESTNRLLAPNIFLFAYHLKEQNNQENQKSFWQECDALLSKFTTETLVENLDFSSTNRFLLKDKKSYLFHSFRFSQSRRIRSTLANSR